MIDIHSHLLPGVDDGSPSIDVSVSVLQRFASDGLKSLVCTPHLNASQAHTAPVERYAEIFDELRRHAPPEMELQLGWEIMLDSPGVDLTLPHLALGGSRALLVEFTRGGLPRGGDQELRRIMRSGRVPVLAHPERYYGCTLAHVIEWRAMGVVIQTGATMLMGRGGPANLARDMLAAGCIDVLASDNHGDHRSLSAAREWLLEMGAPEQAELLTHRNAGLVLADEDPLPVPPLPIRFLERVKRLFGR